MSRRSFSVVQDTRVCGLNLKCVLNASHLYTELSTCDRITQDGSEPGLNVL